MVAVLALAVLAYQTMRAECSPPNLQYAYAVRSQTSHTRPEQARNGQTHLNAQSTRANLELADLQRRLDEETQRRQDAERRLENTIVEKETLVKEIHHRIKNNLAIVATLLEMASRGIHDPEALAALDNSKGRILAMAMIHEQLYRSHNLKTIDLGERISRLAADLLFAYSNNPSIRLQVNVEPVMIDMERAIPCGLIVNELITNALKYGFPAGEAGVIGVSVRMVDEQIEICISDDGARLPDAFFNVKTKSLGMDLVRILSYQLRAEMHVQRDGITSIALRFPFLDPEAQ
jgi:two-component sensor histidine kinase